MTRNYHLLIFGYLASLTLLLQSVANESTAAETIARKPNIVLFFADDLGYGEVGCYGQTIIKTPNIDRLAAEGMRFTRHYSGNPVCAPSRCALLTGYHTGHAFVRGNKEMGGWGPDEPEGQLPIPENTVTLAKYLKRQGYATAAVGKWGLGGPGSSGHPNKQGFDLFYGYLCQRVAHNYYPTHLWKNNLKDILEGNTYFASRQKFKQPPKQRTGYDRFKTKHYAPDRMSDEALTFIRKNKDRPFFLYYPTPVPHVALQVPADSLAEYSGKLNDQPYLGQKGYLPHPEPRAAYAAMVTRMDRDFGRVLNLLKELELKENTIVLFSSDNGPTFNGGTDSAYFQSAGVFRGLKASVYEGGIRVPLIVRWPGKIKPGSTSDHISANWDYFPTLMELIGESPPTGIDGISFAPTLLGKETQRAHEVLYWELRNQQAVRAGDWKLVRKADRKPRKIRTELFNLKQDISETTNLAESRPRMLQKMLNLAHQSRTPSKHFPSPFDELEK